MSSSKRKKVEDDDFDRILDSYDHDPDEVSDEEFPVNGPAPTG